MFIIKPIIICLAALIIINLLKNFSPEYTSVVAILCGTMVFIYLIPYIRNIVDTIKEISCKSNDITNVTELLMRIVFIALACEFASHLCSDGQENYLASKINFAGKVLILSIISPTVLSFLEYVIEMINSL